MGNKTVKCEKYIFLFRITCCFLLLALSLFSLSRLNIPGQAPPRQQQCNETGFVCCPTGQLSETATISNDDQPGPLKNPSLPSYMDPSKQTTSEQNSTPEPLLELHDVPEAKPNAVYNPKPGYCGVKRVSLQHRISFLSLRKLKKIPRQIFRLSLFLFKDVSSR